MLSERILRSSEEAMFVSKPRVFFTKVFRIYWSDEELKPVIKNKEARKKMAETLIKKCWNLIIKMFNIVFKISVFN